MSSYSIQVLIEKLARLSLSQDSIETLSLWIIHHKSKAKTSVDTWLEEFKKVDAERRLILLYLTNDVLQNGRRRGADEFLTLFQDALRVAVPLIRGQKIQSNVERMLKIWKDRKVYDNQFLGELDMIIEPSRKPSDDGKPTESKLSLLEDALAELRKFEAELKVKSSHLSHLQVDVNHPTSSLEQLKDKADGGKVSTQFEEASLKLQDYCECLGVEVNERIDILAMLRDTKAFFTYKYSEFKRTVQNYKELGSRVNTLREKLQHHLKDLERAQSTATSDPLADADITVEGDMEIESDTEETSETGGGPSSVTTVTTQSDVQQSIVSSTTSQPKIQIAPITSTTLTRLNVMSTPMLLSQPPPVTPVQNSNYYPPAFSGPRAPPNNYPRPFHPPPGQRPPPGMFPLRPPNRPPPFVRPMRPRPPPLPHPNPGPNSTTPPPSTRASVAIPPPNPIEKPPPRLPPPPNVTGVVMTPRPMAMSAMSLPATSNMIVGAPMLYQEGENQDEESKERSFLDQRLENLKMSSKMFGESSINDKELDSEYEKNSDSELFTNFTEERNDQAMSPGDASPKINMNNPILQALYSSPQSTNTPKSSTAEENKSQNNITTNSQTDENNKPAIIDPSQIKITPALTSLLDQLLPSLSKSLERKRKSNDTEPPASKSLRINSEQLGPGALQAKPSVPPPWIREQEQLEPHLRPRFPPPRFRGPPYEMRPHRPRGLARFPPRLPPPRFPQRPMRDYLPAEASGPYRPAFIRRTGYF